LVDDVVGKKLLKRWEDDRDNLAECWIDNVTDQTVDGGSDSTEKTDDGVDDRVEKVGNIDQQVVDGGKERRDEVTNGWKNSLQNLTQCLVENSGEVDDACKVEQCRDVGKTTR